MKKWLFVASHNSCILYIFKIWHKSLKTSNIVIHSLKSVTYVGSMSIILVYRNWIWRLLEITGFLLRFISSYLYVCLIDKCLRDEELLEAVISPPLMAFQLKCWHTSFMTANALRPEHNGHILQVVLSTAFSWQLILYMIQIPLRFFLGNFVKRGQHCSSILYLLGSHYMNELWPCQMTYILHKASLS